MAFYVRHNRKLIKKITEGVSRILAILLIIAGYSYIASTSPQSLPASATAEGVKGVKVPVIMYHSLLKDSSYHGKYVISPSEFESDLKYLKEQGYTTILVSDLINYTQGGSLPEKPIIITFDDGYYNNYCYAFPLLQKYNSKAVISVIGYFTELYSGTDEKSAYYSHLTWENIIEMTQSGLVEIANHTYNLHSKKAGKLGVARIDGESDEIYGERISNDIIRMQGLLHKNTGINATTFVYPYGEYSKDSQKLIKKLGFHCSFSCEERINTVTDDPDSLFDLGRYLRRSGISSEDFFSRILGE